MLCPSTGPEWGILSNCFNRSVPQVLMLGLDAAGKTTILYKLHIGMLKADLDTHAQAQARILSS